MKIIKTKKYATTFEGYDPYKVDWAGEEQRAKEKSDDELFYALKDAIETSYVSVNAGKYTDQASIYRKELLNRGFSYQQQDKVLRQMGLKSN